MQDSSSKSRSSSSSSKSPSGTDAETNKASSTKQSSSSNPSPSSATTLATLAATDPNDIELGNLQAEGPTLDEAVAQALDHILLSVTQENAEATRIAQLIYNCVTDKKYKIPTGERIEILKILSNFAKSPVVAKEPDLPACLKLFANEFEGWKQHAANAANVAIRDGLVISLCLLIRNEIRFRAQQQAVLGHGASWVAGGYFFIAVNALSMIGGVVQDIGNKVASRRSIAARVLMALATIVVIAAVALNAGTVGYERFIGQIPGFAIYCYLRDFCYYLFPIDSNVDTLPWAGVALSATAYTALQFFIPGWAAEVLAPRAGPGAVNTTEPIDLSQIAMATLIANQEAVAISFNVVVDAMENWYSVYLFHRFEDSKVAKNKSRASGELLAFRHYEQRIQSFAAELLQQKDRNKRAQQLKALGLEIFKAELNRLQQKSEAGDASSFEKRLLGLLKEKLEGRSSSGSDGHSAEGLDALPATLVYGARVKDIEFPDFLTYDEELKKLFAEIGDVAKLKLAETDIAHKISELYTEALILAYMPMPESDTQKNIRMELATRKIYPTALRALIADQADQKVNEPRDPARIKLGLPDPSHATLAKAPDVLRAVMSKMIHTAAYRLEFYIIALGSIAAFVPWVSNANLGAATLPVLFSVFAASVFVGYHLFYIGHDTAIPGRRLALPNSDGAKSPEFNDTQMRDKFEAMHKSIIEALKHPEKYLREPSIDDAGTGNPSGGSSSSSSSSSLSSSSSSPSQSPKDRKPGGVSKWGVVPDAASDAIYLEKPTGAQSDLAVGNMLMMYLSRNDKSCLVKPAQLPTKSETSQFTQLATLAAKSAVRPYRIGSAKTAKKTGSDWTVEPSDALPSLDQLDCIGLSYAVNNKKAAVLVARDRSVHGVIYLIDPAASSAKQIVGKDGGGLESMRDALLSVTDRLKLNAGELLFEIRSATSSDASSSGSRDPSDEQKAIEYPDDGTIRVHRLDPHKKGDAKSPSQAKAPLARVAARGTVPAASSKAIYHEKQVEAYCSVHVFNMMNMYLSKNDQKKRVTADALIEATAKSAKNTAKLPTHEVNYVSFEALEAFAQANRDRYPLFARANISWSEASGYQWFTMSPALDSLDVIGITYQIDPVENANYGERMLDHSIMIARDKTSTSTFYCVDSQQELAKPLASKTMKEAVVEFIYDREKPILSVELIFPVKEDPAAVQLATGLWTGLPKSGADDTAIAAAASKLDDVPPEKLTELIETCYWTLEGQNMALHASDWAQWNTQLNRCRLILLRAYAAHVGDEEPLSSIFKRELDQLQVHLKPRND